jgi:hypothetical protein
MDILRTDFNLFPEIREINLSGNIDSDDPVLNSLKDLKLKIGLVFPTLPASINVKAKISNMPIMVQFNQYVLFPFSLKKNEDFINSSPALLIMINEALMEYYQKLYLLDQKDKKGVFYNAGQSPVDPEISPGIFKERSSGKYLVNNIKEESQFEFYNEQELLKIASSFGAKKTEIIDEDQILGMNQTFDFSFYLLTMLIVLALVFIETIL